MPNTNDTKKSFYSGELIDDIFSKIKSILFDINNPDSQRLMKLLKYTDTEPYNRPDLTLEDMIALLSSREKEEGDRRVFSLPITGDKEIKSNPQLRIFEGKAKKEAVNQNFLIRIPIKFVCVMSKDVAEFQASSTDLYPKNIRYRTIYIICMKLLNGLYVGASPMLTDKDKGYKPIAGAVENGKDWVGAEWELYTRSF